MQGSRVVRSLSTFLTEKLSLLLPCERKGDLSRTKDMNDPKELAKLKARLMLVEQSMDGMEALLVHVLERDKAARDPLAWTKPVTPKA